MLTVTRIGIDSWHENVVYIHRDCQQYRPEDFRAFDKVLVKFDHSAILAVLNTVEDAGILPPDRIGLNDHAFRRLRIKDGQEVHVEPAAPPASLAALRQKVAGATLEDGQILQVVRDIADHRYSRMEIAAFLTACAGFMTADEVLALTRAMIDVGERLHWDEPVVVDKHCIGGIPGNRTSMIVIPIVAAHGLKMPKTSSRAITSPAGTADTMEVLANVDLSVERMREMVHSIGGCLAWGGHVRLSPADDVMISVERPLGIDMPEQMVASILSKKIAAGSTHLVIDMPLGPSAKVTDRSDAVRIRKMFEFVSDNLGLNVQVLFTDGRQPIGRGIGPVLEARDVMAVLRNEPDAPQDLRDRSLLLAGHVLEFDPDLRGGHGHDRARKLLDSGAALRKMEEIIAAQGPPPEICEPGPLTREITSDADGVVTAIDCQRIARIARLAGAPVDKGAGIDLLLKVGEPVGKGQPLYRIHARNPADFQFACDAAFEAHAYDIGHGVEAAP